MWQIRVGDKTLPEKYPTTNGAVQAFMIAEMAKPEGDAIKDPGVYLVGESAVAYKLFYPGDADRDCTQIPTCGGGIVIRWDFELQEKLVAEAKEKLAMFAWLEQEDRWASVNSNFDRGTHRDTQVVYYDARVGWIHCKPGKTFTEAVRNAMNMRINYETQEYFNPPD